MNHSPLSKLEMFVSAAGKNILIPGFRENVKFGYRVQM